MKSENHVLQKYIDLMIHFIKNLKTVQIDFKQEISNLISIFISPKCLNSDNSESSMMFLKWVYNFYTWFKSYVNEESLMSLA